MLSLIIIPPPPSLTPPHDYQAAITSASIDVLRDAPLMVAKQLLSAAIAGGTSPCSPEPDANRTLSVPSSQYNRLASPFP